MKRRIRLNCFVSRLNDGYSSLSLISGMLVVSWSVFFKTKLRFSIRFLNDDDRVANLGIYFISLFITINCKLNLSED